MLKHSKSYSYDNMKMNKLKNQIWQMNRLSIAVQICQGRSENFVDINSDRYHFDQLSINEPSYILFNPYKNHKKLRSSNQHQLRINPSLSQDIKFSINIPEQIKSKLSFQKCCLINPICQSWPERVSFMTFREILSQPFLLVKTQECMNGYKLTQGDIIKFGRQVYLVSEISTNKKSIENNRVYKDQDIYRREKSVNGLCKICYGQSGTDQNNFMISPCKCKGTCQFVHFHCLKEWVQKKILVKSTKNILTYDLAKYTCQICNTQLPKVFILMGKIHRIFVETKPKKKPYIVIKKLLPSNNMHTGPILCNSLTHILQFQNRKSIKIGRKSDNDLIFSDLTVSRKHAQIVYKNGYFELYDRSSRYGTLVSFRNSLQVGQGTEVQMGRFIFTFKKEQQRSKCQEEDSVSHNQ